MVKILPVVLSLVLLLSISALAAPKVITILNTSDFHGNLLEGQKDKSTPPRPWGGEAIVAAYVNQYRMLNPGGTLVLDEGDIMQGPAVSTVFRGQSSIEAYNATGYDAAALGNHEFDWGLDVLKVRVSEAKFPFLAANVFLKATGQRPEWVKPYAIFERDGVKIGVIGLLTMEAPQIIHPNVVGALEFRDATAMATELIPEVRAKGAQLVILLAHLGGDFDRQGVFTGEIASLAQSVKGADLILGGHTHTSVVTKVNGVPVVVPSYQGRALGVTRITFDPDANKVVSVDPFLAPTFGDQIVADAKVQAVIDKYNKDLAPVMAEVLAQTPGGIVRDYENESAMGDLVADVMRKAAKVDVAFTNSGGLRTDIAAGPITLGKIWEVIPFDNTIVTMNLTGAQVLDLLANRAKGMAQTSGVKFTWKDIPGDKVKREIVSATLFDGRTIDSKATYTVCTNDFMAGGGDNFTAFKSGTSVVNTQILLRDALIAFLKAESAAGRPVAPAVEGRAVQVQ
jgi:2',3'-cyclic-nucleotide 2'-phosphodiesterase/3'-nucleotidase